MKGWGSACAWAILCAVLLTSGHAVVAQTAPGVGLPDDCRSRTRDTKDALEKRKAATEKKMQAVRAALAEASSQDPKAKALVRELRRLQEDLVEIIFAFDCLQRPSPAPERVTHRKFAPPAPPAPPAAPTPPAAPAPPQVNHRGLQPAPSAAKSPTDRQAAPSPKAVDVTAYYATNRVRAAAPATPADTFSNDGLAELTFGRIVVSIPLSHEPGSIELPQLWKFERTPDPNKHFVLKSVSPLATDAARRELSERLNASPSKSMFVYVHGYNMGFQEAALRTAQLAHDLKFPGIPFFYSWPSANRIRSYLQDEETARLCESVFEAVLSELAKLPVQDIYIVAHSMGNRIVGHGVQAYVEKGKNTKMIKELLLAAPDINADLFKTTIAPRLAQMQGTRTTIYASSFDLALMASKVMHGFRRVGESSGGVLVYNGMDTVDASGASTSIRNFGHSYLVDSTTVIKDLSSVIGKRLAAKARGLIQKGAAPDLYWQLPGTAP